MLPTLWFDGREYSRAWMTAQIDRVLAGLHALHCEEGDTVAAMLRNGPEYVALVLACRQSGLFMASVNWHFKALEANHILVDSGARVLFVHDDLLHQVIDGIPAGVAVVGVPANGGPTSAALDWTRFGLDAAPMPPRSEFSHGAITYTSGTTGKPKGVRRIPSPLDQRVRMDRELQEVTDLVYGTGPDIVAYLSAPIYHSAAMSYLVHMCKLGATLVLEPRFDPKQALSLMELHRVTHGYLVPTMYQRLLGLEPDESRRFDLTSLRQVASTGSPCPPAIKRSMIEWLGPIVTEAYGSSEAGYTTFIDSDAWQSHPGSAGRPLPYAQVRILDELGREMPAQSVGLIYVRQFAVPDFTYINRPDARTSIERDGLITLGDMGYLDDDGFLYICDRKSDMVISGGVNIYPAEIESVLQTMPGIADCAVFGIPDAEFGEGLAAAIQSIPGVRIDATDVQAYLRARIANYKVPRVVEIHASLPREDTGKIFKRLLREPYWQASSRAI